MRVCRLFVGRALCFQWYGCVEIARGLWPLDLRAGSWVGVVGRPLVVHMSALVAGAEVPEMWSVVDGHSVVVGQGHGRGLCWLCLGFVVVVVGRETTAWQVGCCPFGVLPYALVAGGVRDPLRVVGSGLRLGMLVAGHLCLVGGELGWVSGLHIILLCLFSYIDSRFERELIISHGAGYMEPNQQ
jgi:hypothetical protein